MIDRCAHLFYWLFITRLGNGIATKPVSEKERDTLYECAHSNINFYCRQSKRQKRSRQEAPSHARQPLLQTFVTFHMQSETFAFNIARARKLFSPIATPSCIILRFSILLRRQHRSRSRRISHDVYMRRCVFTSSHPFQTGIQVGKDICYLTSKQQQKIWILARFFY